MCDEKLEILQFRVKFGLVKSLPYFGWYNYIKTQKYAIQKKS